MAQGRIPFLRAHYLPTQVLIKIGNNATNHIIGIRRASRLMQLPLVCNDMVLICWPQMRSWNRWQNLREHIAIHYPSWRVSCQIAPIVLLNGVSTKVNESLHNMSLSHLNNIRRMSRDVLHVSVLSFNSLRQVTINLVNTAHDPTWIPKISSKPWISPCPLYDL